MRPNRSILAAWVLTTALSFATTRGTWYLVDDGMWYRGESWRGPFTSVSARAVPREILTVPTQYRRHWAASVRY